jgi:replication-associated recombination protein RarA
MSPLLINMATVISKPLERQDETTLIADSESPPFRIKLAVQSRCSIGKLSAIDNSCNKSCFGEFGVEALLDSERQSAVHGKLLIADSE